MNKKFSAFKDKFIFIAVPLLIVLAAVIYFNSDVFVSGAFSSEVELNDPLNYYQKNGTSYVINNTGLEIMVFSDNKYQYSIHGGCTDDGFYSARDIKADNSGNIYILDKLINENGKNVDAERIVKYDKDGNFSDMVFTKPHSDGRSVLMLYNLCVFDDGVSFVCTSPDNSFSVQTLNFDDTSTNRFKMYAYDNIYESAWDFAFDEQENIYVSSKAGTVEKIDSATKARTVIYSGGFDSQTYYSVPTNIEYAADGNIYFNDIGYRKIQKLSPDGSISTVIDVCEPVGDNLGAFNESPIYSGLFVSEDLSVATIYSQTHFVETENGDGEEVYEYKLFIKSADGAQLMNGSVFEKTSALFARSIVVSVLAFICAAILVIIALFAVSAITKVRISGTIKTQIIIIFTAICVTCIAIYITVTENNSVYYGEVMNNLENISTMMARNISKDDLANINTPTDFMNASYRGISDYVLDVLNDDLNRERGIYCVIYKVQNDIVSAVYADDAIYGSSYPMPGSFEGSAEQMIYQTGETVTSFAHSSAEGSYMCVLTPIFSENGDSVVGLMEIGTDLYSITERNRQQVINTILLVTTTVMVSVLLISEFIVIAANMKKKKLTSVKNAVLDSGMIRPIVFLFFFASNMPTAFLPIYSRALWNSSFPIPIEVATALPVSAELFLAAVISLAFGFAVSKIGVKLMAIIGASLFAAGNVMCALSSDLTFLIIASAVTGIGDGLLVLAVNSYIAGYDEEEQKNNGFMHYNAALLSGTNCGTVIGSSIAENFGYSMAYVAATAISALLVLCCIICIGNRKYSRAETVAAEKTNIFKFLFKPNIIKYFMLISVPYLICASFLNYFFPIFGEENALTPTQISMAFLLMGVISIYFSSGLTKLSSEKLGAKKSMLLATALYASALLLFIIRPQISSCYIAVVLFAFADSFGFTSQSVYYSTLPETVAVGEGPAMGINSGFESAASTVGPLIFGFALMFGNVAGITMIAVGFIGLALLFVLTSFKIKRRTRSENANSAKCD